jgi:HEAT repeat protein
MFKQIIYAGFFSLILLQSGNCQNQVEDKKTPITRADKQDEEKKKMDLLVHKILEKDPTAITLAKQLGSFAVSSLKPLLANEDPVVREIVVRSLNESGNSSLSDTFVQTLKDNSPTVRAAALNALQKHLSPNSYALLLQTYDKVLDPNQRKEVALLAGKIMGANPNHLKQVCQNELEPEALEGCLAALAKMGDGAAQEEFLRRARNARDRELKRFLDYIDYIGKVWALKGLNSALNDKTPLQEIGDCVITDLAEKKNNVKEQITEYLRACDMALNLIAKIARAVFSFPVNGITNYTDQQLVEAKRFLNSLP